MMPRFMDELKLDGLARDALVCKLSLIHGMFIEKAMKEAQKKAREK